MPLSTQLHNICLEYIDSQPIGHYNVITNIKGYLKTRKYCKVCLKAYRDRHICFSTCFTCGSQPACTDNSVVNCDDCGRDFYGQLCYSNHLINKICKRYKKCKICDRDYSGYTLHNRMRYRCVTCFEYYDEQPHRCFIAPLLWSKVKKEDSFKKYFVFFDIEAIQQTAIDNKLFHQPSLLVCRINCDRCYDSSTKTTSICDICTGEQTYWGQYCVTNFTKFILNDLAKRVKGCRFTLIQIV